ncbi:hypothetical protein BZA77DRAFT_342896 [Pyronema omphalodes]|nr:hypothetical protein BZA77DRAFT_342896 [Pyronema omphalodes]
MPDSDDDEAHLEVAEWLAQMQRSAANKRRQTREKMTNSFNTELSEVTASVVKQLSEREKAANAERVVLLEKLRELLKKRQDVEERLARELEEINRCFVEVVTKVFKDVGEAEKAVWEVKTDMVGCGDGNGEGKDGGI